MGKIRVREINVFYAEPDDRPVQVVLLHKEPEVSGDSPIYGEIILYITNAQPGKEMDDSLLELTSAGYEIIYTEGLASLLGKLQVTSEANKFVDSLFNKKGKD